MPLVLDPKTGKWKNVVGADDPTHGIGGVGPPGWSTPTKKKDDNTDNGDASTYTDVYDPSTVGKRERPFRNPPIGSALGRPPVDLTGQPLQRGYIVEDFPLAGGVSIADVPDITKRYRLDFHYNPQTINETWEVDWESDPLAQQQMPQIGNIRPKGVTFSWDMILDRTRYNPKVPQGVMADTRILAKILTRGIGGPDSALNALYPAPVKVVFGPGGVGTNFAQKVRYRGRRIPHNQWIKSPLGATGLITNYSCQYTRFNKLMIPTAAFVSMSVLVNYWLPSTSTDPAAKATSNGTTRSTRDYGLRRTGPS